MNKKEMLSFSLFVISLFFLGFIFFSGMNTNISIIIDNQEEIIQDIPASYSLINVLFMILLSSVVSISFFYYVSDLSKKLEMTRKQKIHYNLLEGDEKTVFEFLLDKGEILQKDLVYELKLSKVKVTRILDKLEEKKVIVRMSYGNTNKVLLKD